MLSKKGVASSLNLIQGRTVGLKYLQIKSSVFKRQKDGFAYKLAALIGKRYFISKKATDKRDSEERR